MKKVIYKYPVSTGTFTHMMPKGALILCVQMQSGIPQMWAVVDPEANEEKRTFVVIGTGWRAMPISQYIGTFQDPPFVWHLFEGS